jgi:hypothetical protein
MISDLLLTVAGWSKPTEVAKAPTFSAGPNENPLFCRTVTFSAEESQSLVFQFF